MTGDEITKKIFTHMKQFKKIESTAFSHCIVYHKAQGIVVERKHSKFFLTDRFLTVEFPECRTEGRMQTETRSNLEGQMQGVRSIWNTNKKRDCQRNAFRNAQQLFYLVFS